MERIISSIYDGRCSQCGGKTLINELVYYDPDAPRGRKTRHINCQSSEQVKKARQEEEERKAREALRIRASTASYNFSMGQEVKFAGAFPLHIRALSDMDDDWWLHPGDIGTIKRMYNDAGWPNIVVEFKKGITVISPLNLDNANQTFKY